MTLVRNAWLLALVLWLGAADGPVWGQKGKRVAHVFAGPAPAHDVDVILARPTDKSITVSVLAYMAMSAHITFGTSREKHSATTETRRLDPRVPSEFLVNDLLPDTRYYYRLYLREPEAEQPTAGPEYTFHTQRKPGSAFTFTMQADSHLDQGTRTAIYQRTLTNVVADDPDFHIDLGDTFMTDKYERHTDALPQYFAQRYYLGLVGRSAPLLLVLGNHDGERFDRYEDRAECMPVWACRTRKQLFPNPFADGFYTGNMSEVKHVGRLEDYYAWEWGDALFIALDPFWTTNERSRGDRNWARTLGEQQYRWLEQTLAGSKAKFKFVFIHHLVGGLDQSGRGGSEAAGLYEWGGKNKDGKEEFSTKRPGWSMPIHALLVKHGVSAVFHGHDHFFAHQELDGIVYQLVPQPGHPGFERLRNVEEYGYFRGTFLPPSGHIRVAVSPEKATVSYVRSYLANDESPTRHNGDVSFTYSPRPRKKQLPAEHPLRFNKIPTPSSPLKIPLFRAHAGMVTAGTPIRWHRPSWTVDHE